MSRALSQKTQTLGIIKEWWEVSTKLDPFKLDAFDSADWRALPDMPCSWVMRMCLLTAIQIKGTPRGITYVLLFISLIQ